MNSPRLSTGTRGLTLAEMLVTATLFLAISAAMGAMLFQTQRASEKTVATNDADSKVLLLFEKLRAELRKGRVIDNPVPEELHYWMYETENGMPKFTGPGDLEFLSTGGVPDIAEVTVENDNLVRTFQNEKSVLTSVGGEGQVSFNWLVGIQALVVEGQVGDVHDSRTSLSSVKKFHFILALSNVE